MSSEARTPAGQLVIWHLIDSSTIGGAERHIAIVIQCLRERNIPAEAVLYQDYPANRWVGQLAAGQVPFRILDGSISGLIAALRQAQPALLHVHGYKAGILGRFPARLFGIPVVTTFHSGERSSGRLGFYELVDEWTSILGERICVSSAIQARMPFKAAVIKNFVPDSAAPPANALPRRAAFVGRLTKEKGPDTFCDIAAHRPSEAEWHVYGDGPMRRELETRFGKIVQFHGLVPDLTDVWPDTGLVVMPSRFEGLPYAALEALSAGVPILAARVGGLPEAVVESETGWMFEPGDVAGALAGFDAWLALDPSAQAEMRFRCWRHVKDYFSESSEMPKLISVYRKAGYQI